MRVLNSSPSNNPGTSAFANNVFILSRNSVSKIEDSSIIKQTLVPSAARQPVDPGHKLCKGCLSTSTWTN
ncbi:hypothetical protein OGAPHI_001993 [Ogataea philodendri]|uniref:Uncharacterized protein n=1 Tax=Ogataea philodendri TaxID=1378263 RepID=A0A9P8T795_9ASCO|nr:uncharacterized protein OGAPHI_001993 [Ogataea philodendri]KAH3668239.1 hypothetical protein OGAPHI_001993 [Ogataea philodendri]